MASLLKALRFSRGDDEIEAGKSWGGMRGAAQNRFGFQASWSRLGDLGWIILRCGKSMEKPRCRG